MNVVAFKEPIASLGFAKPLQVPDELEGLISLLLAEKVMTYLEVGTRYGGTFERVMNALPRGAHGVALDFPGGKFGDCESVPILFAALTRLKMDGRNVDCILGPSSAPEVVERANALGPYDAVFIDADHSYQAVKRDFELYSGMGRMVILHDIAAPPGHTSKLGAPVEVPRLWNEIRRKGRICEIIAPGSDMGIGVLWK